MRRTYLVAEIDRIRLYPFSECYTHCIQWKLHPTREKEEFRLLSKLSKRRPKLQCKKEENLLRAFSYCFLISRLKDAEDEQTRNIAYMTVVKIAA